MRPAAAKLKSWAEHPDQAVREIFGAVPDPWQDDVLKAFSILNKDPKYFQIVLKACKNPGKTAVLAWCCWIFLLTRPYCEIAAISITSDNLRDNLWTEMSRWQAKSRLLTETFKWTAERITCNEAPEKWWMSARSFSKTADPNQQSSALSGTHADYVMFVLDECGDIPPAVLATAEAALGSGKEARILMAGNPSSLEGALYRACVLDRKYWLVYEVTGDPDNPKRAPRVKLAWAIQMIEKYGRESPWVKINVLGEFPETALNALLSPADVQKAMERDIDEHLYRFAQKRLGVDVAFEGDDRTVLFPRQGLMAFNPIEVQMAPTNDDYCNQIAARIMKVRSKWNQDTTYLDCTGGFGDGVYSAMKTRNFDVVKVKFSAKATKHEDYHLKRSEMWFEMAEWVKGGGSLPNIPELVTELVTPTYSLRNGKFFLEPKEFYKERIGRSPDLADALALTFADPEMPAMSEMDKMEKYARGRRVVRAEWDPHTGMEEE